LGRPEEFTLARPYSATGELNKGFMLLGLEIYPIYGEISSGD